LSSPERPQHRERARSSDRLGEGARLGCIEGDGDHAGGFDRDGEFCDGGHLDQLHFGPKYPLELGDARCEATLQRQRPEPDDDRHEGSFCVEGAILRAIRRPGYR